MDQSLAKRLVDDTPIADCLASQLSHFESHRVQFRDDAASLWKRLKSVAHLHILTETRAVLTESETWTMIEIWPQLRIAS